jgi:hypothetical protein
MVSKSKSYAKILRCIGSCTTREQIETTRNMLETYYKVFQDYSSVGDLWVKYNLKFFEIKDGKI